MTERILSLMKCLCEHADHFSPPNELGDSHAYAHECENVVDVMTSHGTFPQCRECVASGHMRGFRTGEITAEIFLNRVGSLPIQDDLARCNCKDEGKVGHWQCGWSEDQQMPRFMVGELAPRVSSSTALVPSWDHQYVTAVLDLGLIKQGGMALADAHIRATFHTALGYQGGIRG
jgi:hypothetical protein